MPADRRFAVLIDADNVSDKYIKIILDEVSNQGVATYKRIYGNWTSPGMASWKNVLLDYSVTPIQQYSYTTGKNATDSAMIIDAMDILYSGKVEGFCLVSSDSDFTRLATRLREGGMTVIGMGEKKTPKPFIAACNLFRYLDVLASQAEEAPAPAPEEKPAPAPEKEKEQPKPAKSRSGRKKAAREEPREDPELTAMRAAIKAIVAEQSDEDDWLGVSMIGNLLVKRYPDFDVRNFGFSKLTPFVQSLGIFEVRTEQGKDNTRQTYVRIK
ncbi:MAG TPA: NYN domain-containing protein [Candidatus Fournierella merdigallinarum]|nr:NYN domain-containing protein [Candidatus Fournierella merdigallinarum]